MLDMLSDIELAALLGRKPHPKGTFYPNISGKVVMVTGAGGTIGSELCMQLFNSEVASIILVDHSEFALYQVNELLLELHKKNSKSITSFFPLLASVTDEFEMAEIFRKFKPHIVFHAAAYKHVLLVERNARIGIKNNVIGTYLTGKLSKEFGVERYILVSSDKAINPVNIMGESKRLAELMILAIAHEALNTRFSIARFGNVLGSSGSVLPKFLMQITRGNPVTISNPEATRYFMLASEAVSLLLEITNLEQSNGTTYCFDMGKPVNILDLSKRLLRMKASVMPKGDLEIEWVGLQPFEKIHEEPVITSGSRPTQHPNIFQIPKDVGYKLTTKSLLDSLDDIHKKYLCNEHEDKSLQN